MAVIVFPQSTTTLRKLCYFKCIDYRIPYFNKGNSYISTCWSCLNALYGKSWTAIEVHVFCSILFFFPDFIYTIHLIHYYVYRIYDRHTQLHTLTHTHIHALNTLYLLFKRKKTWDIWLMYWTRLYYKTSYFSRLELPLLIKNMKNIILLRNIQFSVVFFT